MKKSSKQLLNKLFYSYTIIILFIVVSLMAYFISSTKSRLLETNLNYMEMMNERAVSYLETCMEIVDSIQNDLYQSYELLDDVLHYLRYEDEDYWKYRLDQYMGSSFLDYNGYDSLIQRILETYPDIIKVELISYDKKEVTAFYRGDKIRKDSGIQQRMSDIEEGSLAKKGEFSFQKEIRDPLTMQSVGCFLVTFSAEQFTAIKNYYSKADLIVYNSQGTVIYYASNQYPPETIIEADKKGDMEESLKAYLLRGSVKEYQVCSFLDKQTSDYLSPSIFFTILGVGLFLITVGEIYIHYHLNRLAKRLNYILDGMRKITTGDLSVRLKADADGDELDLISYNFNEMCKKLDRYIQKSYLAEIEQKNAELEVLQNQINPHFLYNTLEAIRMKAISNGDREVGKMLYSMAVIFRSQLKDADVITLIQEIHYCKKYLELFEYRYQGKFKSVVECPEELINYPIIKFIMQPVIENYFIHGIRAQMEGNEIKVRVEKQEKMLVIHVMDNGTGMEAEVMDQKNQELRENKADTRKTIGLTNVNRRIKAYYGMEYGVSLLHSDEGGLHVILRVGLEREDEDEKGYAG